MHTVTTWLMRTVIVIAAAFMIFIAAGPVHAQTPGAPAAADQAAPAAPGAAAPAGAPAAATPAPPKIDSGDTAWMLTSTALVLMMTIQMIIRIVVTQFVEQCDTIRLM